MILHQNCSCSPIADSASFSFTAKFKDRVEILSKIAKVKTDSQAGQGTKPEGECKKSQYHLLCFALKSHAFTALSTQGLAKKYYSMTQIFLLLLVTGGCCNNAAEINQYTITVGSKSHSYRTSSSWGRIQTESTWKLLCCSSLVDVFFKPKYFPFSLEIWHSCRIVQKIPPHRKATLIFSKTTLSACTSSL